MGGPLLPIPDDPARFRERAEEFFGCSRLRCEACETLVKHVDGRRLSGWMTAADHDALYEDPRPEVSKYLGAGAAAESFRVYYCRCSARSIAGFDEADLMDDGWSCTGHPLP